VWWLRADLGITLATTKVATWADQSGRGDANRNVSQGTDANRPTYNTTDAAFNNQPTISFTAASSHFLPGVGNWSATYTQPVTFGVIGTATASASNAFFLGARAGSEYMDIYKTTANRPASLVGTVPGTIEQVATPLASPCVILISVGAGSDGVFRLNSRSHVGSSTGGAAYTATSVGANGMTVGRRSIAALQYLDGKVAEVFMWNKTLNVGEVNKLMNYVTARYGIAVAG
jgi:hypothetical protein